MREGEPMKAPFSPQTLILALCEDYGQWTLLDGSLYRFF
jgi:hypothetical protein